MEMVNYMVQISFFQRTLTIFIILCIQLSYMQNNYMCDKTLLANSQKTQLKEDIFFFQWCIYRFDQQIYKYMYKVDKYNAFIQTLSI